MNEEITRLCVAIFACREEGLHLLSCSYQLESKVFLILPLEYLSIGGPTAQKKNDSGSLKLALEALYTHIKYEQATETDGKQYEQYDGKKQVVSHKVAGIKDSSKTLLGN